MTDHEPVAVLGVGALGTVVARALAAAGHPTTAWNRTPARLAALVDGYPAVWPATTVADAVVDASVVLLVVADADAAHAVLDAAGDALGGRTVVTLTSTTPEAAGALTARIGPGHLDGAAMTGTRLVGDPRAVLLYSGDPVTFAAAEPTLRALGDARHVGEAPGAASLWDTALLGIGLGLLTGFHQAVALVGGPAARVGAVATGLLPFLTGLLGEHAAQIDAGRYPADDGSLAVYAAAVDHLVATAAARGVPTDLPAAVRAVLERGLVAGPGDEGLAAVVEVLRPGGDHALP